MSTIGELLARKGAIEANRHRASGQIWGQAIGQLGQIPGQALAQYQQIRDDGQAQRDREQLRDVRTAQIGNVDANTAATLNATAATQQAMDETGRARRAQINVEEGLRKVFTGGQRPSLEVLTDIAGPERAQKIMNGFATLDVLQAQGDEVRLANDEVKRYFSGRLAQGVMALPTDLQADSWALIRQAAIDAGLGHDASIPEALSQPWLEQIAQWGDPPAAAADDPYSDDAYGKALARYAELLGRPLTSEDELDFRRQFTDAGASQAAVLGRQRDDEIAAGIAEAIERGEQQPTLTGLRQHTAGVRNELAERGYDLTAATQDWTAMSTHLRTLNSATQVRLRQATSFAAESLDLVDSLIDKWDAGQFPVLNKARLAAAKQGVLGPEAQTIATELDGLFTDLISELAVVYRGGLSPTDSSIELARDNLESDWSAPVMRNMVGLLRRQLRVRVNSLATTGVAGTPTNLYDRAQPTMDVETGERTMPPPPAPPRVRETGGNGLSDPLGIR